MAFSAQPSGPSQWELKGETEVVPTGVAEVQADGVGQT